MNVPALQRQLLSDPPRWLKFDEEVQAWWQNHRDYGVAAPSLDGTLNERVLLSWRILRYMLWVQNRIDYQEPLESLELDWTQPAPAGLRPGLAAKWEVPLDAHHIEGPGVGRLFIVAALESVQALGIEDCAALALMIPDGLPPDPTAWKDAWIKPALLMAFEEYLANWTIEQLADKSLGGARKALEAEFGLSYKEARGVCSMAMVLLQNHLAADIEVRRALMVGRLERTMERAREACDERTVLGAMRLLSQVEGLTATQPDEAMEQFAQVVATHARKPSAPLALEAKDALDE